MTSTDRHRRASRRRSRAAGVAGAALVAGLLPLLGPAAPASAAECTSEVAPTADPLPIPTGPGCDDTTPPDTAIEGVTPTPNDSKWIRQDSVSFAFAGHHTDEDSDPIRFECQFYEGSTPPAEWSACQSPVTYDDLAETPEGVHTFAVRAVDAADDDIDLTTAPFYPSENDEPDVDQSPASTQVKVDTVTPVVLVFGGPYDADGTGWPVVTKRPKVRYLLDGSEEKLNYRCQLDAIDFPCQEGRVTARKIRGGDHVFTAHATDRAGNRSSTVARQFVMPYDLGRAPGWKRSKGKGYFDQDVMTSNQIGMRLKFKARNVRRLVLLAPSGPRLDKVRLRIGNGIWHVVDLGRRKKKDQRQYLIRGPGSPLVSGTIVIEPLGRVAVDALLFPPA